VKAQRLAHVRVADSRETMQLTAFSADSHFSGDGHDLGVHRVLRAHRKEVGCTLDAGAMQGSFQLRVADNDGDARAAPHLDERVGRIHLDGDHLEPPTQTRSKSPRVAELAKEDAAYISEAADHDVIFHKRDADLLETVTEKRL
jgi:hypothetical protein